MACIVKLIKFRFFFYFPVTDMVKNVQSYLIQLCNYDKNGTHIYFYCYKGARHGCTL